MIMRVEVEVRLVVVMVGGDCVVRIATTHATKATKAVGAEICQRTSREAGRPRAGPKALK